MRIQFFTISFLLVILASCGDDESKIQLQERELALLEKEKQFALKEADYQQLLRMRDSINIKKDTTPAFLALPETVLGSWTSKITCTASSCPDYIVGDQRTDLWEFAQDSFAQVLVKNINNNNSLIRVYTGTYDGSSIHLSFHTDSTAAKKVEMLVTLNDIKEAKIRGTRNITVDNKCGATFTIELDRAKKSDK